MNFDHLVSGNVGIVHLVFSLLALIFGSSVLISKKGTAVHKKMGYLYAVSMFILLVTAFMLYNLFGKFGIFHWAAVISSLTLIAGIIPMIIKKPKSYITMHFNSMYWSVFGLYGAFMAETLVRIPDVIIDGRGIPNELFYNLVGVAVFITMGTGYFIMWRKKKTWSNFDPTHMSTWPPHN